MRRMGLSRVISRTVVVVFLLACVIGAAYGKPIRIGYVVMGMDHPLFVAMVQGAKDMAAKLNDDVPGGVDLLLYDSEWRQDKQNAAIENYITMGVDAILVNPVTAKEILPAIQKLKAAKIPVIAIDTRPSGTAVDSFISVDHFQGGYILGYRVAQQFKGKGRFAIIWAVGNEQAAQRVRGFEKGLEEGCLIMGYKNQFEDLGKFSGITGPIRETSRQVTESLLIKYPKGKIDFVFGQTDEFALGALQAIKNANRLGDCKVVAMDNNEDMRRAVKSGEILFTTVHLAREIGAAGMDIAVRAARKEFYPPEMLFNFQLVDQENSKYENGWWGDPYKPSFSARLFPEQMAELYDLGKYRYTGPAR